MADAPSSERVSVCTPGLTSTGTNESVGALTPSVSVTSLNMVVKPAGASAACSCRSSGDGAESKEFTGLDRQPAPESTRLGRAFLLRATKRGSLTTGAPVYYREVKVGVVETSRLADDATEVLIRIRVYTPYVDLVRANTVFWNAGGVTFRVSLLGAELKSTSFD